MKHYKIQLNLLASLAFVSTISYAQKSKIDINGVYQYVIPNREPSKIDIGELIMPDTLKITQEAQERNRMTDSLKKNNPRYSKEYVSPLYPLELRYES